MYLPPNLNQARVLVTVKAYPKPSGKYEELVCTAGFTEDGKWIRIYPVPYRFLADDQMYPKYSWITLDLVRNTSDFRPESYRPKQGLDEHIQVGQVLGTQDAWAARKQLVLREVFTSMNELIALAKGDDKKSLATVRPTEITGFSIEVTDREWKEKWTNQALQRSFLELTQPPTGQRRQIIRKVPYNYFYEFLTDGDSSPRKLKIEDWEIGALYWHCLINTQGDESAANDLVRQKYFHDFTKKKDVHLFVGTTKQFHNVAPNPFIIIGVFYPPISKQPSLFVSA
jgi:hypothetical protein